MPAVPGRSDDVLTVIARAGPAASTNAAAASVCVPFKRPAGKLVCIGKGFRTGQRSSTRGRLQVPLRGSKGGEPGGPFGGLRQRAGVARRVFREDDTGASGPIPRICNAKWPLGEVPAA